MSKKRNYFLKLNLLCISRAHVAGRVERQSQCLWGSPPPGVTWLHLGKHGFSSPCNAKLFLAPAFLGEYQDKTQPSCQS